MASIKAQSHEMDSARLAKMEVHVFVGGLVELCVRARGKKRAKGERSLLR